MRFCSWTHFVGIFAIKYLIGLYWLCLIVLFLVVFWGLFLLKRTRQCQCLELWEKLKANVRNIRPEGKWWYKTLFCGKFFLAGIVL